MWRLSLQFTYGIGVTGFRIWNSEGTRFHSWPCYQLSNWRPLWQLFFSPSELWDIGLLQNNQWSSLPITFLARILLSTAKVENDNGFSILGSSRDSSFCFRFLWPCIVNIRWRERTNKMQLTRCLLSNFMSQHVSDIIMTIIRRIRPCPTACGVLPGCAGCGWLWSCGAVSWVVCTVHSAQCTQLTTHLVGSLSSPYLLFVFAPRPTVRNV